MVYGAVLAGGIGKRVERYAIPKQFITLCGNPIIVMTLRTFLENKNIDDIYVAVHHDWIQYAEKLFNDSFSADELDRIKIVEGGKERLDSFVNIMNDIITHRGLQDDDILICHDSVRPFVRQQMIDDCIQATLEDKLALTVVPVTDTIHISQIDPDFIDGTLPRENLYNGQNPSGFNIKLLHQSLKLFTEEEKRRITGTTQLMLQLGYRIRLVKGHTSNFKITTDNDLDIAERIVRGQSSNTSIQVLDCTLRDGGIVIDFAFGNEQMNNIKFILEDSGVEYIECGYIDQKKGTEEGKTQFDSERSIRKHLLNSGKKSGVQYLAMIDYGTYDLNTLENRRPDGIDGIRFAFHKENWREAIIQAKIILQKGYDLYIQPMVSMRYNDAEYRELIRMCNTELKGAKAFYIVDSFGQMDNLMLHHKIEIADQYVDMQMKIGLHSHNHRQMAFSNTCTFVNFPCKHDRMVDASIMGMGKGPGNCCTELIIPILNAKGKAYNSVGIYEEIARYFSALKQEKPWGYSLDYYLSSLYGCTPSYVKLFLKDERITTDDLVSLLKNMPENKKAACDRAFAKDYLAQYLESK